jgi:nucleoside-diphosphate-sugar epimerase
VVRPPGVQQTMRVLVTGHRGYVGAHLVELLRSRGYAVTGCEIGLFDG